MGGIQATPVEGTLTVQQASRFPKPHTSPASPPLSLPCASKPTPLPCHVPLGPPPLPCDPRPPLPLLRVHRQCQPTHPEYHCRGGARAQSPLRQSQGQALAAASGGGAAAAAGVGAWSATGATPVPGEEAGAHSLRSMDSQSRLSMRHGGGSMNAGLVNELGQRIDEQQAENEELKK